MLEARHTFRVERPAEAIFAFVADSRNEPKWNQACREAELESDEPLGEGSVFRLALRFMGRTLEVHQRIETWEPHRRLVFATLPGSLPMRADYTFEADGDGGTQIHVAVEGELRELLGIMPEILFKPLFQKSLEKDARLQKACLEAEIPADVIG